MNIHRMPVKLILPDFTRQKTAVTVYMENSSAEVIAPRRSLCQCPDDYWTEWWHAGICSTALGHFAIWGFKVKQNLDNKLIFPIAYSKHLLVKEKKNECILDGMIKSGIRYMEEVSEPFKQCQDFLTRQKIPFPVLEFWGQSEKKEPTLCTVLGTHTGFFLQTHAVITHTKKKIRKFP